MGGSKSGGSDPDLPPDKRPRTKGRSQSQGQGLLHVAMEGRREAGAGGRTAFPSLYCMSVWLCPN